MMELPCLAEITNRNMRPGPRTKLERASRVEEKSSRRLIAAKLMSNGVSCSRSTNKCLIKKRSPSSGLCAELIVTDARLSASVQRPTASPARSWNTLISTAL